MLRISFGVLQTLDIVAENPDKFRVVALAAGSNVTLLADQVTARCINVIEFAMVWFFQFTASLKF